MKKSVLALVCASMSSVFASDPHDYMIHISDNVAVEAQVVTNMPTQTASQ